MIDKRKIELLLNREMLPATKLFFYNSTDSTNTRAREYARENSEHQAAVFIAEEQTSGRGRRGRSFYSRGGVGVYMTLLLYPESRGEDATKITAEAAVKLRSAITELTPVDLKIKWVNDIYARGSNDEKYKKLAGILAEAEMNSKGEIEYLCLGLGINVYKTALPDEISEIAVSLEEVTGNRISREELIAKIIGEFLCSASGGEFLCGASGGELLCGAGSGELLSCYREHSLTLGKDINVKPLFGEEYRARAIGIADDYSLLVKREDGTEELIFSGEVSTEI